MPAIDQLARIPIPPAMLQFRDTAALHDHLAAMGGIETREIGRSREGQPLYGYTMGRGPRAVSLIAGCHADEPVGPMTAQALPALVRTHAPELLDRFTFRVVPQINPDGADRNRPWFSDPPDFRTYLDRVVREAPGDDIEFGFADAPGARPECRAALPFLWPSPVAAHCSLHGMAWAEGAWFLINAPWADRAAGLMDGLDELCRAHGLPRMELDRKGEKGFRRIRKGFSTTPHSQAMKDYFLQRGDPATAEKFLPSSMEAAMAAGGDPLCLVSELPLFLLNVPASLDDPVLYRFRDALEAAQANPEPGALDVLAQTFRLRPLPLAQQVALQFAMIVLGLDQVSPAPARPSR